jgi:hypothetical protein
MDQFEKLLGIPEECRTAPKPGEPTTYQPGALEVVLREGAGRLVDRFEQKVAELVVRLIEAPEARLAGAEEAIRQFNALTEQALENHEYLSKELQERAALVYGRIQKLLEYPGPSPAGPPGGSKKVHTRRMSAASTVPTRDLLDLVRSYPKYRYQSLVLQQVSGVYLAIRGLLSDQLREVDYCRARLTELHGMFEAANQAEAARRGQAVAGRWLLPEGCESLDDAVRRLEESVTPEHLAELDRRVQELMRKQFRALVQVCMTSSNVLRALLPAMHQEAAAYLGSALESANAAEVYLRQFALEQDGQFVLTVEMKEDLETVFARSSPDLTGTPPDGELCLLAVPPGNAEGPFRQLAREALPEAQWNAVPGGEEIVFYREQSHRSLSAFRQFGPLAREAYQRLSAQAHATPHTRADIPEWRTAVAGGQASA